MGCRSHSKCWSHYKVMVILAQPTRYCDEHGIILIYLGIYIDVAT